MSIDTLHPRPWRQGRYEAGEYRGDVYAADDELVLEAATPEAAAFIANCANTSYDVEQRALSKRMPEFRGSSS